jgi:nitrite reductase/ring-hydroxylating ferredoxin subunit
MVWRVAAAESDVREGDVLGIVIDGQHLALYRLGGEFYATSNICSHEFALLSDGFVEDGRIECPLHAAQFDIRTGKVLCAPATTSIATWSVKLENNQVLVDM